MVASLHNLNKAMFYPEEGGLQKQIVWENPKKGVVLYLKRIQ